MFRIIRFGIEVASVRNRAVPMRDGPFAQQASWRVHEYSCWHPAPFLRHFPIPNHPHARNAAIASECAAAQDQFEAMHRTMFGLADSLGTLSWSSLASRAGVPDSAAFVRCLESPESAAAISRDSVAAYKLGLRGTPTLLIGSTRVDGLPLLDSLRVYVKRASTDAP